MKTKNQTGQNMLELAVDKAANEDGISTGARDNVASDRKQAWSPLEVWRTRVKTATPHNHADKAQIQG